MNHRVIFFIEQLILFYIYRPVLKNTPPEKMHCPQNIGVLGFPKRCIGIIVFRPFHFICFFRRARGCLNPPPAPPTNLINTEQHWEIYFCAK